MALKNSIFCILIGLFVAFVSCSSVIMAKRNIKIQTQDTTYRSEIKNPPPVPAIVTPNVLHINQPKRYDFRPFKDSLINGLMSINAKVDKVNQRLDTGLQNQSLYMRRQSQMFSDLAFLKDQVSNLRIDTSLLYKKLSQSSKVNSDIKQEATIGKTVINFIINLLIFIAVGIVLIFAMVLYLAQRERKRRKTNIL